MHQIAGAILGVAGVVCIFFNQFALSLDNGLGALMLFTAVLSSAIYTLLLKRSAEGRDLITTVALFCGFTALTLWVLAMFSLDKISFPTTIKPWLALFYLALFGSVLTFLSYVYLIKNVSLMVSSTLVFIQPVIAMVVDLAWGENHSLDKAFVLGVSIIALAIVVSLGPKHFSRTEEKT